MILDPRLAVGIYLGRLDPTTAQDIDETIAMPVNCGNGKMAVDALVSLMASNWPANAVKSPPTAQELQDAWDSYTNAENTRQGIKDAFKSRYQGGVSTWRGMEGKSFDTWTAAEQRLFLDVAGTLLGLLKSDGTAIPAEQVLDRLEDAVNKRVG